MLKLIAHPTILEATRIKVQFITNMTTLELNNLESQIENLLKLHRQMRAENHSLQQKLGKLTQERAILLEKNQKATVKIKRIISQLKE